jgi:nucleoside-diphosphate-sugar epimerase
MRKQMQGQTVLVTGASGFIGSHVTEKLLEAGAHVRGLARAPAKGAWLAQRGVEIIQGDLTDSDSLKRAMQGCSIVFSIAAWLGSPNTWEAARGINIDGTRALVEAAIQAGVRRIVHTSSIAAYGPVSAGVIDESWPLSAVDAYGRTKAQSEDIVFGYRDRIEASVIRPAQIFGPRGGAWTRGLFGAVKRGLPVLIGGGAGTFHPCYVENLTDAFMLAATRAEAIAEAFTIVDAVSTWRAFTGYYARMTGRALRSIPVWPVRLIAYMMLLASKITHRPPAATPEMIAFVTGSARYSTEKARRLLGWSPRVSIEEGMRRTAAWLRETGRLT